MDKRATGSSVRVGSGSPQAKKKMPTAGGPRGTVSMGKKGKMAKARVAVCGKY